MYAAAGLLCLGSKRAAWAPETTTFRRAGAQGTPCVFSRHGLAKPHVARPRPAPTPSSTTPWLQQTLAKRVSMSPAAATPPGIRELGEDVWRGDKLPAECRLVALGVPFGHPAGVYPAVRQHLLGGKTPVLQVLTAVGLTVRSTRGRRNMLGPQKGLLIPAKISEHVPRRSIWWRCRIHWGV